MVTILPPPATTPPDTGADYLVVHATALYAESRRRELATVRLAEDGREAESERERAFATQLSQEAQALIARAVRQVTAAAGVA